MAEVPWVEKPLPNESFMLRNGSKSVLATHRAGHQAFARVEKTPACGVVPRNAEQSCKSAAQCPSPSGWNDSGSWA